MTLHLLWMNYQVLLCLQSEASTPFTVTRALGNEAAHLNKRVDDTNIGTGIKDLVEAGLSVDQLQLVELLVILLKNKENTLQ